MTDHKTKTSETWASHLAANDLRHERLAPERGGALPTRCLPYSTLIACAAANGKLHFRREVVQIFVQYKISKPRLIESHTEVAARRQYQNSD
eukprot:6212246-Pleurochrysis_carterae.AAC.1